MKTIYVAERNLDLTEGRGPIIAIGYFRTITDARLAAKGWGVQGVGDGIVRPTILYDSFVEFKLDETEKIKACALAKLTDEEKEALGLE